MGGEVAVKQIELAEKQLLEDGAYAISLRQ
jgi:hypothetical protein